MSPRARVRALGDIGVTLAGLPILCAVLPLTLSACAGRNTDARDQRDDPGRRDVAVDATLDPNTSDPDLAETDNDVSAPDSDLSDAPDSSDGSTPDAPDGPDADAPDAPGDPDAATPDTPDAASELPPAASEEHCAEVAAFGPVFGDVVARWIAQDDASPWPEERGAPVVFVGSSSIRRWDLLAATFTDYDPLQRGFGGAQLGEVALFADELVVRHHPRAVVVYAGTNDLAAGVSSDTVVERFRCLRQRVGLGLGWGVPVVFITVAPTQARWASWDAAAAVNARVAALTVDDPAVTVADVATPMLATGSPPAASLFVSDGLHVSAAGYELWSAVVGDTLESLLEPSPPATAHFLSAGTRVLIDLGPTDGTNGEATPSPDYLGQHWNNWYPIVGGARVLPGEHLDGLVTADGVATPIDLVVAGDFAANGWQNGGLRWPDQTLLGDLAISSATGDYFYADGDDITGGFYLRGLSPTQTFTLRMFASREEAERRVTRYVVRGETSREVSVQTSGPGAGSDSEARNDDTLAELSGLRPDAWGNLFVDLQVEAGAFAYVSLIELVVER
ncbi:MAG: hypothetical protein H6698_08105 [Myxococcales bacterium]|nr:hypothetical protein [Myxococcales bacterium]